MHGISLASASQGAGQAGTVQETNRTHTLQPSIVAITPNSVAVSARLRLLALPGTYKFRMNFPLCSLGPVWRLVLMHKNAKLALAPPNRSANESAKV